MKFQCEVTNSTVKMKKDGDYQYKATTVTLETFRLDHSAVGLVNKEVNVFLHDIQFVAKVVNVTAKIKKIKKVPFQYFVVKVEFEGVRDDISRLVNKSVDAELVE